jgi:hypothetical protein
LKYSIQKKHLNQWQLNSKTLGAACERGIEPPAVEALAMRKKQRIKI